MSGLWGREDGCHPIEIVPVWEVPPSPPPPPPPWKVLPNRKSTPIVSPEDVSPQETIVSCSSLEVFPYGKPSTGEQIKKDCIKRSNDLHVLKNTKNIEHVIRQRGNSVMAQIPEM